MISTLPENKEDVQHRIRQLLRAGFLKECDKRDPESDLISIRNSFYLDKDNNLEVIGIGAARNASLNIMSMYIHLACTSERPMEFRNI